MSDYRMEDNGSSQLPDFNSIPAETWRAGKAPIRRVLNRVRPTTDSQDKRNDVVRYMRRLIENAIRGVEVLQFGSVPLKTYLPQADTDLTVACTPDWECNLPRDVYDALLAEKRNGNDAFKLTDLQFIDAEVKLVKCAVNNIRMNVSFNQLGGICALCFLEHVDRAIGKNHLFKRSIILIKSWCYYESHILGAIHGFVSTYALETLVLNIFRMYNASLASPLMVLYRFFEYYSKFDWNKFGISIDGPVHLSLLPDIVVENPICDPLLGGEYLRDLINMYAVPCKEPVGNRPHFVREVINIVDPLKTNNNLGKNIHSGTFCRIKLALTHGARELAEVLGLPREKIQEGIKNFLDNTLNMSKSKFSLNSLYADHDTKGGFDESHNLNNVAELAGDFDGNLRNLMFCQWTQGFRYSPAAHPLDVPPSANYRQINNNSNGQSSAPSQVHTPKRRLVFGSFGSVSMTTSELE